MSAWAKELDALSNRVTTRTHAQPVQVGTDDAFQQFLDMLRRSVTIRFKRFLFQDVNGGLLYVEEGGKARFLGAVYMHDVAVTTSAEDTLIHGGCIYNEVRP